MVSFYLMGAKWNRNMKKCLVNVFLISLLRVLQRVWITCEIWVSSSGVETECEPCGDLRAGLSMRLGSALLVGGDPSPVPSPHLIFLSCNNRNAGSCIVEGESGFRDGGRLSTTPQVFMFSLAAISKESLCPANPRSPLRSGLRNCPPALKEDTSQTLPCGSFCIPCTPASFVLQPAQCLLVSSPLGVIVAQRTQGTWWGEWSSSPMTKARLVG